MTIRRKSLPSSVVLAGLLLLFAAGAAAQQPATPKAKKVAAQSHPAEPPVVRLPGIPAYHAAPPHAPLPATLPASDFTDPRVQTAYAMAARIKNVLYQEPCYCRCDKTLSHTSLYSCYAGTHASVCETCLMEGIFTYLETKKGKSPGEIRAMIERGDWKSINLNEFLNPSRY